MTKSAFASSDKFNFRHGTEEFSIAGTYKMENGLSSRFALRMSSKGEKKVRRDDKLYGKVSEHVGVIPIVMVSPADISLVSESGEERRRFVNSVLSQMDKEYLSALQHYNRLLLQRNKILKDQGYDQSLLEVIDMRMSALADPIFHARKRFVEDLKPIVAQYYKAVSGGSEMVDIEYESELFRAPLDQILASSYERDRIMKHTTSGIHRDDFAFRMNGHPIRRYGSQGQQKSFLVSLKFAQYEIMKQKYGFAPMLLLDDVFDKLDMGRISNLLQMVSGNDFGQIFITDSNKVRMAGIVDGLTQDRAYYDTLSGTFTRL
jgi:DNA replication and repair protein RecF